jgi:hypothetical protein
LRGRRRASQTYVGRLVEFQLNGDPGRYGIADEVQGAADEARHNDSVPALGDCYNRFFDATKRQGAKHARARRARLKKAEYPNPGRTLLQTRVCSRAGTVRRPVDSVSGALIWT